MSVISTSIPKRSAGRLAVYAAVLAIGVALAFAPFLFPDVRAQEVAARICVFIVLVASYDLLIGYTGIVSFAHTMFFGLGAYGTALALKAMGPGWGLERHPLVYWVLGFYFPLLMVETAIVGWLSHKARH